jgi:hypothetical protein
MQARFHVRLQDESKYTIVAERNVIAIRSSAMHNAYPSVNAPKEMVSIHILHIPSLSWPSVRSCIYFSAPPNAPLLTGGLLGVPGLPLSFPSAASLSRKSCHNSASDSLLLELLAMSMGSLALLSDAVEGVRRKPDMLGRRRPVDAAPGRARPACSRCSEEVLVGKCDVGKRARRRTICPA